MENHILKQFIYEKTLNWDDFTKKIILLGKFISDSQDQAIVLLKKKEFPNEYNNQLTKILQLETYHKNDIYEKLWIQFGVSDFNEIECEIIYPAQPFHIIKYSKSSFQIVNESYEDYKKYVEKYIQTQTTQKNLQWIYNIIDKIAEQEKVLIQNEDYILIRDYTFNPDSKIQNLHILAIVQDRSIRSLRDLNSQHLKMLKSILNDGLEIIAQTYQLETQLIKVYVHYLPSFYHFHVHFMHVESQGDDYRHHLLDTIIQNIEIKSDYYQSVNLNYIVNENQYRKIFDK